MTTAAQIRTAWQSGIFQHATLLAMTERIHLYDFFAALQAENLPQAELDGAWFNKQVHFIQFIVMNEPVEFEVAAGSTNAERVQFDAQFRYFLQHGPSGANYRTAIDNAETIHGLVKTELGKTWGSTVAYWQVLNTNAPQLVTVQEQPTWVVTYTYRAFVDNN